MDDLSWWPLCPVIETMKIRSLKLQMLCASCLMTGMISAQSCYAIEPGWYEQSTDAAKCKLIEQEFGLADLWVMLQEKGWEIKARVLPPSPIVMSSDEFRQLVENKKKDFLVVYVQAPDYKFSAEQPPYTPEHLAKVQKMAADAKPFIATLGYKRVLIYAHGSTSMRLGYLVLSDTTISVK
jgi:hypothetical protein